MPLPGSLVVKTVWSLWGFLFKLCTNVYSDLRMNCLDFGVKVKVTVTLHIAKALSQECFQGVTLNFAHINFNSRSHLVNVTSKGCEEFSSYLKHIPTQVCGHCNLTFRDKTSLEAFVLSAAGANPNLERRQGTPWTSCQLIAGPSLMSNVGFSISLKDTSTCSSTLPGARIWTSNLLITSRPALPAALKLPCLKGILIHMSTLTQGTD